MVFRTLFNEPRPKGFLEIGEVLSELDIDVADHDNLSITITCDPKTGPKFDERTEGFSAEVIYSEDDRDAQFTTLGYRSLNELERDLRAADFDLRNAIYGVTPDIRDMIFRDDPDETTVSTIISKAEDFAEIRINHETASKWWKETMEPLYKGKADEPVLKFVEETDFQDTPGDPFDFTTFNQHANPNKQENPDMVFKHEIFILANTLTAAVHRAQTELLEVNRLALAISDKIGQSAFNEDTTQPTVTELVLTLDASPLTEALEELAQRVSIGLDADAQSAVESSSHVETKDFDAAMEDALAKGVETALAVEVPTEAPQPLPKSSSVPSVGQTPAVTAEPLDQSDDAKDFRAVASFFLNTYAGARDGLLIEANVFNATWDHAGRKIVPNLSKHLVKVPGSKMIWTQRLNSLFKKNIGTTVDAVLYGSTNPVSMQLVRDTDGSYSFIKV